MHCNEQWVELSPHAQKWDSSYAFFKPCTILHPQHDCASLKTHHLSGIESQMGKKPTVVLPAKCNKIAHYNSRIHTTINRSIRLAWILDKCLAWYQQVVIREMGEERNLNHRIIKSVDYVSVLQMLQCLHSQSVFYIVHYIVQSAMMAYIQCAMDVGLPFCFCKHWTTRQWWPVCSQLLKSIW